LKSPDPPSNKALTSFGFSGIGLEINLPPKEFYERQIAAIRLTGRHVFLFQLLFQVSSARTLSG
jgi:hypothetical protein